MRIFLICLFFSFYQLTQAQYYYSTREEATIEMKDGTIKKGYFSFRKNKVRYCVRYNRDCEKIPMDLVKKITKKLEEPMNTVRPELDYLPLILEDGDIVFAGLMFEGETHDLYEVSVHTPEDYIKSVVYITKKGDDKIIDTYFLYGGKLKDRHIELLGKYFTLCPDFVADRSMALAYLEVECKE